jgi:hypothetical protein
MAYLSRSLLVETPETARFVPRRNVRPEPERAAELSAS